MSIEKITANPIVAAPRRKTPAGDSGRVALSSVTFGDSVSLHPKSSQRIDDDVYYLIRSTPKVLQHDHYNGSMPLSLIKWSLIRDILKGRREGEIGDLSLEELRKEYRISRSLEYAKNMRPEAYAEEDASQVIDEAKANGAEKAGESGETDGSHGSPPIDTSGLGQYRVAYDKIPKLIKSVHYAYMGALEYTHKMANHNVRYFELRTNPIPSQEVDIPDTQIINGIRLQLGKSENDVMETVHANEGRLPPPLLSAIRQEMDNVNENLIRKVQARIWKEKGREETLADLITAIKQELETTPEDLIQSIQMGIDDARDDIRKSRKEIDYGLILLAYRHGDNTPDPETGRPRRVEKAMEVARIAIDLKKKGYNIAAIDLAGSEAPYPVTDFEPFFNLVHEYNSGVTPEKRLGITIHAGETRRSGHLEGWESVREAVRLGWRPYTPLRIGHGVEIMKESKILQDAFAEFKLNPDTWMQKYPPEKILKESPVLRDIIEKGIALEMCIKSNRHTGIIPFHTEHPALFLSRLGAKVTVNTDNMIVDNTDPTNEFVKLYKYQDMRHEDRIQTLKDGLETAFIFDPVRKKAIMDDVARNVAYIDRNSTMQLGICKERNDEREPSPVKALKIELLCHFRAVIQSLINFVDRIKSDLERYLDL